MERIYGEILEAPKAMRDNRRIVLVDIDGTISKLGDRISHLSETPCNWDAFYSRVHEDEPIQKIVQLVSALKNRYEIVYCTGRREDVRELTIGWMVLNGIYFERHVQILMRKKGDHRHDIEVKPELLNEAGIRLDEIEFVLEDRNSMVKKWRELGLTCLQVAEGDF